MKIGGLGEFEGVRKALQKEESVKNKPAAPSSSTGGAPVREDEVRISSQAKVLGKLRKIPDVRQEEIKRILAKQDNGTLMTPEAIKESVAKMIDSLL